MKKLFKRFGAMFIVVAMLVAMIPMTVLAADPTGKVYFDLNYKDAPTGEIKNVKEGTFFVTYYYVETPTTPQREGYSFVGWYKDATGNQEVDKTLSGQPVVSKDDKDKNITYYAKWQEDAFYFKTTKLVEDAQQKIDSTSSVIRLLHGQDEQEFTCVVNGTSIPSGDDGSLKIEELKINGKAVFNKNDYFTVVDTNVPAKTIEIEKRTGVYVDDTAWKTEETVSSGNELVVYGNDGQVKKIMYIAQDGSQEIEKKNVTSYPVPDGTYTLSYNESQSKVTLTKVHNYATITEPGMASDLKYTGDPQDLIKTAAVPTNGTARYAVVTRTSRGEPVSPEAEDWTNEIADITGINAGTYYVWYYAAATTDGYEDSIPAYMSVTIAKKELPVPTPTYVYDGTDKTGFDFENKPYRQGLYPWGGTNTAKDADTYEVLLVLENTDNYKWENSSGDWDIYREATWTITQREAKGTDFECTVPTGDALNYDGQDKVAEVSLAAPLENPGTITVTYENSKGEEVLHPYLPGKYFVYAQVAGGDGTNFESNVKPVRVGRFTVNDVEVVEGDKGVFVEGSDKTLTFKANGPFDEQSFKEQDKGRTFNGITVDGFSVDPNAYTVKEGSTVVTLSNDYLKTLRAGEHTIVFVYDNSNVLAEATFTVQAAESPKTGDTNTSFLWIILASLAFVSLVAGAYKFIGSDI